MKAVLTHVKKHWVVYVALLIYLAIFYKVFFQGLFAFPGNLLASWFFPYSSGGWEGYNSATTHTEFIAADVVRQLYPWRDLAMDMFKSLQIPLWNPYAFAGTPLLANLQTAAFYPLNILFLLLPHTYAWNTYIMLQPIIAFIGMFLFTRSLGVTKFAALFAGVAFACIGYFIIWFEHGVVGHSGIWLPFLLLGIKKFSDTLLFKFLILSSLAICFTLLAGHAQTATYVLLTGGGFYLFTTKNFNFKKRAKGIFILLLGVGAAAVQIIPSLEFMFHSARTTDTSSFIKEQFQMPAEHILTLFAPDIFGNPATLNFWGVDYGEFVIFAGVPALIFAIIALFHAKFEYKWFFVALAALALITALVPQVYSTFAYLKIPVLGTGIPARVLFLFQFALIVFAAFGVDHFLKNKTDKKVLFAIMSIYALLWAMTATNIQIFENMPDDAWGVAQRNLILPTMAAGATCAAVFVFGGRKFAKHSLFLVLAVVALEYGYLMNKYLPFSSLDYVFPSHPLVNHLQEKSPHRIYGYDTATLNANIFVQWRVQSPEGYDPLYIRRYGELFASAQSDKFTRDIPRSDTVLPETSPDRDSHAKEVLMDIIGVKYVVDKDLSAEKNWEFSQERYDLIYQEHEWKVYENRQSFPRAAVFHDFEVIKNDEEIINTLFGEEFPYTTKLILEKDPEIKRDSEQEITEAVVAEYTPNRVKIETDAGGEGVLFLPDAHYPGWKVYVNGEEKEILRANYAFRAVPLRKGQNEIVFVYQPVSFYAGAGITVFSLASLAVIYLRRDKKK